MPTRIAGKTVIITGASSGIGQETALLLSAQGAHVVLAARRAERLDALARRLEAAGGQCLAVTTDVTSATAVQNLVDQALARFGRIDVLVNNAGLMAISPLADRKTDEWERMIDINIKGVLHGIAAVLPVFERQQHGHLINIASVAAHQVGAGAAVYCASKFAVRAISEGLRQETDKVRCTLISPGPVDTELFDGSSSARTVSMLKQAFSRTLSATDIARAIAYAMEQPDQVDINEIIIRPIDSAV
ncbi:MULTISPECIES: SDR family oxidoreductase [Pseudomonas]|uniref:SDR family oxidoreductase n=1 Tax=Pseudomonas TaxID=286 RepID=UPI00093A5BFF|nr:MULTISPECIES: SDR family oxidoreductase [Pseudomonas]MDH0639329.1 SDR family oxidoreductase [Pseudomonas sp. GD03860]